MVRKSRKTKTKARKLKGKWLGIGEPKSTAVTVYQPQKAEVSTKVLKRRKKAEPTWSWSSTMVGGAPSPRYEEATVVPYKKTKRPPKSAGAIAGQERLKAERKAAQAEKKRLAEIAKFRGKAEVEEAKGRFLKAVAKKRAYRRVATRLHPLGGLASGSLSAAGKSILYGRRDKPKKIGW